MQVQLNDGHAAELREPNQLTNAERRPIIAAIDRGDKSKIPDDLRDELAKVIAKKDPAGDQLEQLQLLAREAELSAMISTFTKAEDEMRVADVLITVFVKSWTLELDIPIERPIVDDDGYLIGSEVLDDLSAYDWDQLAYATGAFMPRIKQARLLPGTPPSRPSAPSVKRGGRTTKSS